MKSEIRVAETRVKSEIRGPKSDGQPRLRFADSDSAATNSMNRRAFFQQSTLWILGSSLAGCQYRYNLHGGLSDSPVARIGLLTDLHYADRPPAGNRFFRETLPKLDECVTQLNALGPDFVVELGDFIDAGETVEEETRYLRTIEAAFARIKAPRHYVLGNHCVWTLTKEQFRANSAARESYYSFDQNGCHFVILDACFRADGVPYGARNFVWTDTEIPAAQRDWLKQDLERARRPCLVFVHQRLDVTGEYGVKSAPAVRAILEQSGKVLAVFQGHFHQNDYREINGIPYCTLAAMIEGAGPEHNAYGLLSVYKDGRLKLDGYRRQQSYPLISSR